MIFCLPDLRWFDPYPFIIPAVQLRVLRVLWVITNSILRGKDAWADRWLRSGEICFFLLEEKALLLFEFNVIFGFDLGGFSSASASLGLYLKV